MDYSLLSSILHAILVASTPLVFAGLGALIQERAGVLNLGVEGLMIVGALAGFAIALAGYPLLFSVIAAALAGASLAAIFALLVLRLYANPVATGLALTLFGLGLSALAEINLPEKYAFKHLFLSFTALSILWYVGVFD